MALLAGAAACGGGEATRARPARVQFDTTYFAQRLNAPADPPGTSPRVCQSAFAGGATWSGVYTSLRLTALEDLSTPTDLGRGVRSYVAGAVHASAVNGNGTHGAVWRRVETSAGPRINELRDLGAIWIDRILREPQPRAHTSHAFAVNDAGQAVGSANRGGIGRAMFYDYERDVMIDLDEESSADGPRADGLAHGSHPTIRWPPAGPPKFADPPMTGACRASEPSAAYGVGEVERTVTSVALNASDEPAEGAPRATVTRDETAVVGTAGACGTPGTAAVRWDVTVEAVACPDGAVRTRHRVDARGLGPWERSGPGVRDAVYASIAYAINGRGVAVGRQISLDNQPVVFGAPENAPVTTSPFAVQPDGNAAAFGVSDCPPRPPVAPGAPEPACAGSGFVVLAGAAPPTRGAFRVSGFPAAPSASPLTLQLPSQAPEETRTVRARAITRDASVVVGQFVAASAWGTVWTFDPESGQYLGRTLASITSNGPSGYSDVTGVNEAGEMVAQSAAGYFISPENAPGGPVRVGGGATGCDLPAPPAPQHIPRDESDAARAAALRALCGL